MASAFQTNAIRRYIATMLVAVAIFLPVSAIAAGPQTTVQPMGGTVAALVADAKKLMPGDSAKALQLAIVAERKLREKPVDKGRNRNLAEVQWLQGEALLRLNEPERAQPLIAMAIAALAKEKPATKLHGDLLLTRGQIEVRRAEVGAGLADFQAAHDIYRALGETRSQAIALKTIASLYREADDAETAMKYDNQSAEIYKGDLGLDLSNYNNRGNFLFQSNELAKAEAQYRLALAVARQLKSPLLEARVLGNIARAQLKADRVDEADRTLAQGLAISERGEARGWHAQLLAIKAQAYFQRGQYARAAQAIDEAFKGVDLGATSLSFRDAHETAYRTFNRIGRSDRALVHLEALKRLDDKTAKLAASTNTALMAARFDYANQNLKIAKLKADEAERSAAFERARARTDRFIFVGVVLVSLVGVSLLIFGLLTIRRSRNEVRAANIDLGKTNAALEKALAAKTEFLATTSHEIRTPLNGILGMTQVMLADQSLADATRDRLNVVHGAGVTMRALVDDILDVAKMETGNLTLEAVPVDLRATLVEVSRLWEEQARSRGIAFAVDLERCPSRIIGDAARLRQIVFNLLSNALKFTSDGAVTITAEQLTGDRLRISVSDTGIGIPLDKQEQIFESFRQVDAGTTRKFGGTGLGLSICRNLARAMGGDVTVTSVPGAGSTFAVSLPLQLAPDDTGNADDARPATALMILDRNPISRSMLRALLEQRAGTVDFAGSIDQAIAALAASRPQRILIDDATIRGEADMVDALARLCAASADHPVEVVLLWPSPSDQERQAFEQAGVGRVIAKPIGGAALAAILYPEAMPVDAEPQTPHLVTRAA